MSKGDGGRGGQAEQSKMAMEEEEVGSYAYRIAHLLETMLVST